LELLRARTPVLIWLNLSAHPRRVTITDLHRGLSYTVRELLLASASAPAMASTDRGSDFSVALDSSTGALSGEVVLITGIRQELYGAPIAALFAVVARVSRATESQPVRLLLQPRRRDH
jgi:hypothetical protein